MPFLANTIVWAKITGLPWWPARFVDWGELPGDTQEALRGKQQAIGLEGGPVVFFPCKKPSFDYITKDKLVSYEQGKALGYPSQKGKGAGISFRDACTEADIEHTKPEWMRSV